MKRYLVVRAVVMTTGCRLVIHCRHYTDNLKEIREHYQRIYLTGLPVLLYYIDFQTT